MKRNFWEVGQWLQITAKTKTEAQERFESSCNKCNKQAICNEHKCPIARAYETRCLSIEAEQMSKNAKATCTIHTVRKYKKATPEVKLAKALKTFLTKLENSCSSRKKLFILEEAHIAIELGDYMNAYYILKYRKLPKTAEKVMEIIRQYKEEN